MLVERVVTAHRLLWRHSGIPSFLKDTSGRGKCIDISCCVYVLYVFLIILPVICSAPFVIQWADSVKGTLYIDLPRRDLKRWTVQNKQSGADVCRPLTINRTWGLWLPWKLNAHYKGLAEVIAEQILYKERWKEEQKQITMNDEARLKGNCVRLIR